MGLIFDIHSSRLYDSWYQSPQGKAMDKLTEKMILDLLDPQPDERVLDVGCGEGLSFEAFKQKNKIVGLDTFVSSKIFQPNLYSVPLGRFLVFCMV